MKAQQRRTLFDTRSAMIFAAISLGAAGALQAQAQTAPPSAQFGPGQKTAPDKPGSKPSTGPGSSASPLESAAAFDRADTNKDGQLNAKEAAKFPTIGQRFKELDTDHSGALSRDEFGKGAKS